MRRRGLSILCMPQAKTGPDSHRLTLDPNIIGVMIYFVLAKNSAAHCMHEQYTLRCAFTKDATLSGPKSGVFFVKMEKTVELISMEEPVRIN